MFCTASATSAVSTLMCCTLPLPLRKALSLLILRKRHGASPSNISRGKTRSRRWALSTLPMRATPSFHSKQRTTCHFHPQFIANATMPRESTSGKGLRWATGCNSPIDSPKAMQGSWLGAAKGISVALIQTSVSVHTVYPRSDKHAVHTFELRKTWAAKGAHRKTCWTVSSSKVSFSQRENCCHTRVCKACVQPPTSGARFKSAGSRRKGKGPWLGVEVQGSLPRSSACCLVQPVPFSWAQFQLCGSSYTLRRGNRGLSHPSPAPLIELRFCLEAPGENGLHNKALVFQLNSYPSLDGYAFARVSYQTGTCQI